MRRADRNIDRLTCSHGDLLVVECHFGCAFNDKPVLCSLRVFLVAESLARQDLDSLHLKTAILFEHRVTSPRPAIKLPHTRSSLIRIAGTYLSPQKNTKAQNEPLCPLLLLLLAV